MIKLGITQNSRGVKGWAGRDGLAAASAPFCLKRQIYPPIHQRADKRGGGDGQKPGDNHITSHTPTHRRKSLDTPHAHNGSGDDMGGGDGHTQQGGNKYDNGGTGFRGKALHGGDFGHFHTHGLDDFFAAIKSAQTHDQRRKQDDPNRDFETGDKAAGEQTGGHNTHGVLCVIHTVGQSHKRRRN